MLAGSFLALDVALDAREYIFPEGERSPDFQGFHKLERLIFGWVQGGQRMLDGLQGCSLWQAGGCCNTCACMQLHACAGWAGACLCARGLLVCSQARQPHWRQREDAPALTRLVCAYTSSPPQPHTRCHRPSACLPCSDGAVNELTLQVARGVEQTLSVLAVALNTTAPDRFTAATSWEGMLNLANEVASKKVSSEEETFSDLSLLIFYNNWKGILSQVRCGRWGGLPCSGGGYAGSRPQLATAGHSWAQLAMQCTWRATAGNARGLARNIKVGYWTSCPLLAGDAVLRRRPRGMRGVYDRCAECHRLPELKHQDRGALFLMPCFWHLCCCCMTRCCCCRRTSPACGKKGPCHAAVLQQAGKQRARDHI